MPNETILIVDDEPNVVRLCERLLDRSGYRVFQAIDSHQALEVIRRHPVDLILVDFNMPEVNGFQLIAQARHLQPDLAAVLVTGYGTIETAMTALQEGVDNLILKPFHNTDLIHTVQRTLKDSRQKRDALRMRALQPVFESSEVFFSERNLKLLPALIQTAFDRYLDCQVMVIYRSARDGQPCELLAGQGPAIDELVELLEHPEILNLVETQTIVHIDIDDQAFPGLIGFLNEHKLQALLLISPFSKTHNMIMVVARRADQASFQRLDQEMFTILARQAGAAWDNARLYHNLQVSLDQVQKSQQIMVQAERIAAAGRLTASIAHEINNPLQSLSNCLHLATRKELSPQEHNKYLSMAQSELERLMSTVQQMLDLYRPGGKDRQLVDVNQVVQRTIELLAPQFQKHNIDVRINLAEEPVKTMAVVSQIQQVLINLLINAMEAMPEGGEIEVATAALHKEPANNRSQSGVEIYVCDSGPGVSSEYRDRIYEPFVSTKENGTGLGLAVSYGIISAHGGQIQLMDQAGQGACFRIFLPKKDE